MELLERTRDQAWLTVATLVALVGALALILLPSKATEAPALASAGEPAKPQQVDERLFSLALPADWRRGPGPRGAALFATTPGAELTLWVERAPRLSIERLERNALTRLSQLAPNAGVADRLEGPSPRSTRIELAADPAPGTASSAPTTVSLREAGPYRYYLQTSIEPRAPAERPAEAKLIHDSLRPAPSR